MCLSTSILQQVAQAIALDGEAARSYSIIGRQELLRALPHWLYARQHALSITRRRRSIDAQCIGVPSRMGTLAPCGRTSWPAMSHSCPNHVPNHVPNPCPKLVSMGLCKITRDSKRIIINCFLLNRVQFCKGPYSRVWDMGLGHGLGHDWDMVGTWRPCSRHGQSMATSIQNWLHMGLVLEIAIRNAFCVFVAALCFWRWHGPVMTQPWPNPMTQLQEYWPLRNCTRTGRIALMILLFESHAIWQRPVLPQLGHGIVSRLGHGWLVRGGSCASNWQANSFGNNQLVGTAWWGLGPPWQCLPFWGSFWMSFPLG